MIWSSAQTLNLTGAVCVTAKSACGPQDDSALPGRVRPIGRDEETHMRMIRGMCVGGHVVAFANLRPSAIGGGHKRRRAGSPLVWA